MGGRAGGGARGGGGGTVTAAQVKAAHQQYKAAKASYDKAAAALNYAANTALVPGGNGFKGDFQKVSAKFHKASDRLDKAHAKWSKLKQQKKFQDIRGGNA